MFPIVGGEKRTGLGNMVLTVPSEPGTSAFGQKQAVLALLRSFSAVGLILGVLFFSAALTPSLVPRTYLMQGAISGICFAGGYGLGVFCDWLWRYLELPPPSPAVRRAVLGVAAVFALAVLLFCLSQAAAWQNSIRVLMSVPPVESAHPSFVCSSARRLRSSC